MIPIHLGRWFRSGLNWIHTFCDVIITLLNAHVHHRTAHGSFLDVLEAFAWLFFTPRFSKTAVEDFRNAAAEPSKTTCTKPRLLNCVSGRSRSRLHT